MKFSFVATVFVTLATCPAAAADGDQSLEAWVAGMMERVPFKDGIFDREALAAHSKSYLDDLATHYREIGEGPRRRAEEAGNAFRVHEINDRTEKMIGRATRYVQATMEGMVTTLDPEGTGQVTRKAARLKLEMLAGKADSDSNGLLDRYEAAIAEAAFAKGVDLGMPEAEITLQRELDRYSSYWD